MKKLAAEKVENSLSDHIVLDVRLREDFDVSHLPGAISNCIFEVAFMQRLEESAADKESSYLIYGAGDDSHEALMAAERMESLGYSDVGVLGGGIDNWVASGRTVEGNSEPPEAAAIPN